LEWLIPSVFCLILLAQLLFSVQHMSQHVDESIHLYNGYRALKCGDYAFGREHPPLAKMLVAIPLLWSNAPIDCAVTRTVLDDADLTTRWLYSQDGWWHLLECCIPCYTPRGGTSQCGDDNICDWAFLRVSDENDGCEKNKNKSDHVKNCQKRSLRVDRISGELCKRFVPDILVAIDSGRSELLYSGAESRVADVKCVANKTVSDILKAGGPSIRTKALSRRDFPERCASTAWFVAIDKNEGVVKARFS
jgi:hypothetical protein